MLGHLHDAEDVTQESLVRALRSLARWDQSRDFEPWLLAIAGNRCRTWLAARSRRPAIAPLLAPVVDRAAEPAGFDALAEEVGLAVGHAAGGISAGVFAVSRAGAELSGNCGRARLPRRNRQDLGPQGPSRPGRSARPAQGYWRKRSMRCVDFAVRWNQLLDERRPVEDDAELRRHLDNCPACQAMQAGFELACDVLGWQNANARSEREALAAAAGRSDLAERVLADLSFRRSSVQSDPGRGRSVARRGSSVAAIAAVPVAAAVLLAMYLSGRNGPAAPSRPAMGLGPAIGQTTAVVGSPKRPAAATSLPDVGLSRSIGSRSVSPSQPLSASRAFALRMARWPRASIACPGGRGGGAGHQPGVRHRRRSDSGSGDRTGRRAAARLDLGQRTAGTSRKPPPATHSVSETWQILKQAVPSGDPRRGRWRSLPGTVPICPAKWDCPPERRLRWKSRQFRLCGLRRRLCPAGNARGPYPALQ